MIMMIRRTIPVFLLKDGTILEETLSNETSKAFNLDNSSLYFKNISLLLSSSFTADEEPLISALYDFLSCAFLKDSVASNICCMVLSYELICCSNSPALHNHILTAISVASGDSFLIS